MKPKHPVHTNSNQPIDSVSKELQANRQQVENAKTYLEIYLRKLDEEFTALKNSWRWKVGNTIIRWVERLLLRPKVPLATDHIQEIIKNLQRITKDLNTPVTIRTQSFSKIPISYKRPLQLGFAVTESDFETTRAGDLFTASELATACKDNFNWNYQYLSLAKNDFNAQNLDVLISLWDEFDIRKLNNAKPTLIKIAWVRNYIERWTSQSYFDDFDIYLCSSQKAVAFFKSVTSKSVYLFPIATNPSKFQTAKPKSDYQSDYCFTGNKWNNTRQIENWLNPPNLPYTFKIIGKNWEKHPKFSNYWAGSLPYKEIPYVYASTKLVLDDANETTRFWESVNSRVFDALGMEKLVLSNSVAGVKALFGNAFPIYDSTTSLEKQLNRYLQNDAARKCLASKLQKQVLEHHTYTKRAKKLSQILYEHIQPTYRIAIKIAVPDATQIEYWGDFHFAKGLQKALERRGHTVRIDILPDWYNDAAENDEIVIVLRGLRAYQPNPKQHNIIWNISHPDKISIEEYNSYQQVYIASDSYTTSLKGKLNVPIQSLLQCTDINVFFSNKTSTKDYDLLFVGNSRKEFRKAVKYSLSADLPIHIFGNGWNQFIAEDKIRDTFIPNHQLAKHYQAAKIVLNDHWQDMANKGFISNRIFDAAACGACILTDKVLGLSELFGNNIAIYENESDFHKKANELVQNPSKRKAMGQAIQKTVLEKHTFDHRAATILENIAALIPLTHAT